jgi:hypothetical protein
MKIVTYKATVKNGQVELSEPASLPENAQLYVVVAGVEEAPGFRVASPRLARPEQAREFVKEVLEDQPNAGVR